MANLVITKTIAQACQNIKSRKSSISPISKENNLSHAFFWEEDEDSTSSSTSLSDKVTNLCLMARHKKKDAEVSDSDTYYLPLCNELSKAFHEMHDDALKAFKKFPLGRKIFLNFKEKF